MQFQEAGNHARVRKKGNNLAGKELPLWDCLNVMRFRLRQEPTGCFVTSTVRPCILENKAPFTPGEESLQDQRIMEAIYQSAREGWPVQLPAVHNRDAFHGPEPKES